MLLAWFPHPVVLEHLGHTLVLQECHPINRAADSAAAWSGAYFPFVGEAVEDGNDFCQLRDFVSHVKMIEEVAPVIYLM